MRINPCHGVSLVTRTLINTVRTEARRRQWLEAFIFYLFIFAFYKSIKEKTVGYRISRNFLL
jgi:hypothetical protein